MYPPFGMLQPGRAFESGEYRFGFNGKEKDDEVKGGGNSLDFGARIYDSRLGRFLSTDPKHMTYSYQTPYAFAGNNPIKWIDVEGEGQGDGVLKLYCVEVVLKNGNSLFLIKRYYDNVTPAQLKNYQRDATQNGWYPATVAQMNNFIKNPNQGEFNQKVFGITPSNPSVAPQVTSISDNIQTAGSKNGMSSISPNYTSGTFSLNASRTDATKSGVEGERGNVELYNLNTGEIIYSSNFVQGSSNANGNVVFTANGSFKIKAGEQVGLRVNGTSSGAGVNYTLDLTITTSPPQSPTENNGASNMEDYGNEAPVEEEDYKGNGKILYNE